MGTRWTCPGPSLFVLFCYGQLLPCLRTKGDQDFIAVENGIRQESQAEADPSYSNMTLILSEDDFSNESVATVFLNFYETSAQIVWNQFMEARWNYVTNITRKNQEEMLHKDDLRSWHTEYFGTLARLFNIATYQDPMVKRMLSKLQNIDKAALPQDELREYNKLLAYMETTFSTAQVCLNEGPCLDLQSDLEEIMATSRDPKELLWVWQGWRDAIGRQIRTTYERYVQLSNKAANLNGYSDMGDLWRSKYESDTMEQDLEKLYEELQPLYLNLHAYVRRILHNYYGPHIVNLRGPIPAHLLGNMWAQSWGNILDLVLPFPDKPPEDITKTMKGQHWKPAKMFEEADNFFTSLGLLSVPDDFWIRSMLEKPTDGRQVECEASSWDFYNGKDFRVKKCTEVTVGDLLSIFHQMGHIQYFMQYKNLSVIFRRGANPAFEEAVGSLITLSASSHKYMVNRGLLSQEDQDSEEEVNFLMGVALEKIALIPFAYLMDLFRWRVFDGTIHKEIYNQEWWNLRLKYQGLCPPISRTEDDFDPGAKFHIAANIPYIRYFLSLVLQFQFHETLCQASGHMGPMHRCDIYNSKIAGKILEDALSLGSSKPWPEILQKITGQTSVSTKALMTYFKPLLNWLVAENVRQGDVLGWPDFSCSYKDKSTEVSEFLGIEVEPEVASTLQWVLLVLSSIILLVILGLACRMYYLDKRSVTGAIRAQDTHKENTSERNAGTQSKTVKSCFLGISTDPLLATKRQWILVVLCFLLMLCLIGLVIYILIKQNRKLSWMNAELRREN